MKLYKLIFLLVICLGVLIILLFFFTGSKDAVDTNTTYPEIDLPSVQPQNNVVTPSISVVSLFPDEINPQMQTFIDVHLNKDVFSVTSCKVADERVLSLVFNFLPDARGINTTKSGEQYLQKNFKDIAPYVLYTLDKNPAPRLSDQSLDFSLFDGNLLVYRSVHVIDGQATELFHTWIGNTIYFTKSLTCAELVINDFYHSH